MLNFHFKDKMRGKHSLHFAAQNGNIKYIKWYLQQNGNDDFEETKRILTVKSEHGYIPLVVACNHSQIEVIEYIMEWAAKYDTLQSILCRMKDDDGGNTPLMLCCYKGHKQSVSCLLSKVINPTLRTQMIVDVD